MLGGLVGRLKRQHGSLQLRCVLSATCVGPPPNLICTYMTYMRRVFLVFVLAFAATANAANPSTLVARPSAAADVGDACARACGLELTCRDLKSSFTVRPSESGLSH